MQNKGATVKLLDWQFKQIFAILILRSIGIKGCYLPYYCLIKLNSVSGDMLGLLAISLFNLNIKGGCAWYQPAPNNRPFDRAACEAQRRSLEREHIRQEILYWNDCCENKHNRSKSTNNSVYQAPLPAAPPPPPPQRSVSFRGANQCESLNFM